MPCEQRQLRARAVGTLKQSGMTVRMLDTRTVAKILWSDVAAHFADDSSTLREVVLPDVGLVEWQRILDTLLAASWDVQYSSDGESASVPQRMEDIFVASATSMATLQIRQGGLGVLCALLRRAHLVLQR